MDPKHDRVVGVGRRVRRAGDVEVKAFELGLVQALVGNAIFSEVEQLLLSTLEFWLRAYRPEDDIQVSYQSKKRHASVTNP